MDRNVSLCWIALIVAPALMHTPRASAQASKAPLLVVNQGNATLSFVDPQTSSKVAELSENEPKQFAHEVATSPDFRYAYLPLYGDSGVGKPGNDGRLMLVIDLQTRKVVHTVDFGHGVRPHCVRYEPNRNLLYVTTELDKTVSVIDPNTLKIVGTVPTGQPESHMLAISHDGRRGYTANVSAGTVSVLDLQNRSLVKTIKIAPITQRISLSNDDSMAFTSDQTKPRLAVIDTRTNEISRWVDLPSFGYGTASTKDGKLLLVTLVQAGAVAVVDLKTFTVVRTIPVGLKPQEVIVRPDNRVAYISCFNSDNVVALDLATWKITETIPTGPKADGMAWAAR